MFINEPHNYLEHVTHYTGNNVYIDIYGMDRNKQSDRQTDIFDITRK